MKRLCIFLAALLLFPCIALADGGTAVIIIDAAGCPAGGAEEPWLMQPCINPQHYYFKPNESGEANTLISYSITRRFISDKATLSWQPWRMHYKYENGAYLHIRQSGENGCIFADDAVRRWAKYAASRLMDTGYEQIALVSVGATGDERDDTVLFNMAEEGALLRLFDAIDTARCPHVRDRADAIARAAIKLQDASEPNGLIVLITVGPSDSGPYERRASEACALLCGEGERVRISPFIRIRKSTRARFAIISIGSAPDPLADSLCTMGAKRLKVG